MALPKKGLRKIVVDEITYVWLVKPMKKDGYKYLTITIAPQDNQSKILQYHERYAYQVKNTLQFIDSAKRDNSIQMNSVTNRMVKEIIHTALSNGWDKVKKGTFWVKQDGIGKLSNRLFKTHEKEFISQKNTVNLDCAYELDTIRDRLRYINRFNYLDIEMWAYSPGKLPEEFFYVFWASVNAHQEKYHQQDFFPVEDFIIKMLVRYARLLRIPHDRQRDFLANQKFSNKALSKKEIESSFLQHIRSEEAPLKLREVRVKQANTVFTNGLHYCAIGRTETGLIGFIWDHAG